MIYITSDSHFGHKNIIKFCHRPFSSVEEMDEVMLDNINKVVQPNDILWHLGDFSFGRQKEYRDRIKCKNINLILGNHDHKVKRNVLYALFNIVEDLYILRDGQNTFVLCHYAMKVWPHRHHGAYHAFGHSHSGLKDPELGSMDVGVDGNNYKPYSLQEIKEILKGQNDIREI